MERSSRKRRPRAARALHHWRHRQKKGGPQHTKRSCPLLKQRHKQATTLCQQTKRIPPGNYSKPRAESEGQCGEKARTRESGRDPCAIRSTSCNSSERESKGRRGKVRVLRLLRLLQEEEEATTVETKTHEIRDRQTGPRKHRTDNRARPRQHRNIMKAKQQDETACNTQRVLQHNFGGTRAAGAGGPCKDTSTLRTRQRSASAHSRCPPTKGLQLQQGSHSRLLATCAPLRLSPLGTINAKRMASGLSGPKENEFTQELFDPCLIKEMHPPDSDHADTQ